MPSRAIIACSVALLTWAAPAAAEDFRVLALAQEATGDIAPLRADPAEPGPSEPGTGEPDAAEPDTAKPRYGLVGSQPWDWRLQRYGVKLTQGDLLADLASAAVAPDLVARAERRTATRCVWADLALVGLGVAATGVGLQVFAEPSRQVGQPREVGLQRATADVVAIGGFLVAVSAFGWVAAVPDGTLAYEFTLEEAAQAAAALNQAGLP